VVVDACYPSYEGNQEALGRMIRSEVGPREKDKTNLKKKKNQSK
jgi:hypothetical protein